MNICFRMVQMSKHVMMGALFLFITHALLVMLKWSISFCDMVQTQMLVIIGIILLSMKLQLKERLMFALVRLFTFQNFSEIVCNYSVSELTSFVNLINFCQDEFKYLRTIQDVR